MKAAKLEATGPDTEDVPVSHWVGPTFLLLGVVTVPWALYLALTLPRTAQSGNFRLAWVGFDLLLAAALLRTGQLAARGTARVELPAVASATLLIVDAWFDITTSADFSAMRMAIALAVLVELPLAGLCAWIALHAEAVRARRLRLLPPRGDRQRRS